MSGWRLHWSKVATPPLNVNPELGAFGCATENMDGLVHDVGKLVQRQNAAIARWGREPLGRHRVGLA